METMIDAILDAVFLVIGGMPFVLLAAFLLLAFAIVISALFGGDKKSYQPKALYKCVGLGERYEVGDEIEVRPGDWIPITAPMVGDRNKGFFPCRRPVSPESLEIPERLKQ